MGRVRVIPVLMLICWLFTSDVPLKSKLDIIVTACSFFTRTQVYLSIKVFSEEEFEKQRIFRL
jgi:hypothetical protein